MDGLNKVANKSFGNDGIFANFIVKYAEWDASEKISLPHFRAALHNGGLDEEKRIDTSDIHVKDLLSAVDDRYSVWMSTIDRPFNEPEVMGLTALRDDDNAQLHALSSENDISEEWITKFCSLEKISSLNREFRHANMLWMYRNCLIHESRQLGVKNRPERFDIPHYEHVVCTRQETLHGELYFNLVYSSGFFYKITKAAIENVDGELQRKGINPFDVWPKREIYWIDGFNRSTLLPPY